MTTVRHDWGFEEIQTIYNQPLMELITQANRVHGEHHNRCEVQVCSLISIKTGGCPEDCKYCTQSSRYQTATKAEPMMSVEEVVARAQTAVDKGATRVCLGAAWREVRDSAQFDRVLEMIRRITALGAEVCCTLGMVKEEQARKLKEAGLYAYNHNLDTSRGYYPTIITSRTYDDRLQTLDAVEQAGISVCCGGILGLGESIADRLDLLLTLATRNPHPESVPINQLSPIPGTPLQDRPKVGIWEMVRMVATTRIVLPEAMVRLSAGRLGMSLEQQALCFIAGANSIHAGEKLLTVANPSFDQDEEMFTLFGLTKRPAFACG
jgi:biotin synthase